MNTEKINKYCRTYCVGDIYCGVYPSDQLPPIRKKKPILFICNTDASDREGEHWIAIYVDENRCGEFFDSFGREPGRPFITYLNKHCIHWTYNASQLQSIISGFCGHYCIFYCYYRSRNLNLNAIVAKFTTDTAVNDYLVHKFVCGLKF